MKFDHAYYKSTYGGELTEQEFLRCGESAADVIASFLGVPRFGVGDEVGDSSVLRALCCETDYISARGADGHGSVVKESLGDWSVTYGSGSGASAISSAAIAALRAGGHLARWI